MNSKTVIGKIIQIIPYRERKHYFLPKYLLDMPKDCVILNVRLLEKKPIMLFGIPIFWKRIYYTLVAKDKKGKLSDTWVYEGDTIKFKIAPHIVTFDTVWDVEGAKHISFHDELKIRAKL